DLPAGEAGLAAVLESVGVLVGEDVAGNADGQRGAEVLAGDFLPAGKGDVEQARGGRSAQPAGLEVFTHVVGSGNEAAEGVVAGRVSGFAGFAGVEFTVVVGVEEDGP